MQKLKGLDILRAFAVFFVIIAHYGVWYDDATPVGKFATYAIVPDGRFGVDLFFVLSGFLITSILLNARKTSNGQHPLVIIKNFFIRRALRIFPIYYLLLALLYFVNYPEVRQNFWYFATYTANLLPYHSNTWNRLCHTWTLAVEEQFYLLWPWLIILINEKYLKYVFYAAITTGIISTYIGMQVQGHMEPFLVFNSFDAFGIGGLYACCRLDDKRSEIFETWIKILVIAALCGYFYWSISLLYNYVTLAVWLRKTANSIISIWLIILIIRNRSATVTKYLLGNRFLNYIGKISYGLYLYHFPYLAHIAVALFDKC
jgi:peptidoglycan/LPS O-acetylase OafA/YrhL